MNTLFSPARNKYLGDIVSLRDPAAARRVVRELKQAFKNAKRPSKKLRIARATRLASTRANASLKRKNLSREERKQFKLIAEIYGNAAVTMFREYNRSY